jgi:HAD superfamily hydrolase (TIGR01549 family)
MKYKTIIFDCDGVILNSNEIKTLAFGRVTRKYGEAISQEFMEYNMKYGGVSRYQKFEYFLKNLVGLKDNFDGHYHELLLLYSEEIIHSLMNAEVCEGIDDLRKATSSAKWLVVSGGDEYEIKKVFQHKHLSNLFDGGIHGSPLSKQKIIQREIQSGNISYPVLFLGDSEYDYNMSRIFNLDFIFIHSWTEMPNYQAFFQDKEVSICRRPIDLLNFL